MRFIQKHILLCIFFLGMVVYLPSLANSFVWDDEQFITNNRLVQQLSQAPAYFTTNTTAGSGQPSNYYRPITTLSFAIDYAVWGLHPFFFHLTNALFHAVSGVLVYIVLQIIFKQYKLTKKPEIAALIIAIFFLIHPIQVEAVVYANSRGDSLSALFGLLMLFFYLKLPTISSGNKKLLFALFTIFFFFCALLSKESAIAWIGVPFLFFMMSVLHHMRIARSQLCTAVTGLLGAIIYMTVRLTVLNFQAATQIMWSSTYQESIIVRLTTFFLHVVPNYLSFLLFPFNLHMERIVPIISTTHDISLPLLGGLIFFFLVSILLCLKHFHLVLFSLGWMFLFLAPVSGIIPINGLLYEHWLYIPMIGFWTMIVILALNYVNKKTTYIGCAMLSIIWIGLSVRQIRIWKDPITFYTYTLRYANSARLHNNLGMAYADAHNTTQAIEEYKASIAISDIYPQTHHNLANLYKESGNMNSATQEYQKALQLDPLFPFSINALISLYLEQKNYDQALHWATYAVEKYPHDPSYANIVKELGTRNR